MNIQIGEKYRNAMFEHSKKLKGYETLFDCDRATGFSYYSNKDYICINYKLDGVSKKISVKYRHKDIKKCKVYSNGCLMIFKDKRFVFLPITEDIDENLKLAELCKVLSKKLGDFRFVYVESLCMPCEKNTDEIIRLNLSMESSPVLTLIGVIFIVFFATVFVSSKNDFVPAQRVECESYSGIYKDHEVGYNDAVTIYFEDGREIEVNGECCSSEFEENLERIKKGEQLDVLVNPKHQSAVEIISSDRVILDFARAQRSLYDSAKFFWWLGMFCYFVALYLIVRTIRMLATNKREKINFLID